MFERRLMILLWACSITGLILVARLFQLQVINGSDYRRLADAALIRPAQVLAPIRGRILDRNGVVLASDEPSVDVCVHYGVLAMRPAYLKAVTRQLRREAAAHGAPSLDESQVIEQIREMWSRISEITGEPLSELKQRRGEICVRVETMRQRIWER